MLSHITNLLRNHPYYDAEMIAIVKVDPDYYAQRLVVTLADGAKYEVCISTLYGDDDGGL